MTAAAGRVAGTFRPSLRRLDGAAVEWRQDDGLQPYLATVAAMEARAAAIRQGLAPELVWLLEHPPLYTAGTGARDRPVTPLRLPVHTSGRGGQMTYHGPGQRIAYVLLDLGARGADLRAYVAALEAWLIATLAIFGVVGERRDDRVGVWVRRAGDVAGEDKIAAIGVRVRRWVSFHGVSLNRAPDLGHYDDIVPCGIGDARYGVTSLADLGIEATQAEVDRALRETFPTVFG